MSKQEEIRANREIESGNYREFNCMEALIEDLHRCPYNSCPSCGCIFYLETAVTTHCGGDNGN